MRGLLDEPFSLLPRYGLYRKHPNGIDSQRWNF